MLNSHCDRCSEETKMKPSTFETPKRPEESEKFERKHAEGEDLPAGQQSTKSISREVCVHINT
jgi:hypothetical protein